MVQPGVLALRQLTLGNMHPPCVWGESNPKNELTDKHLDAEKGLRGW